jgi:hypothetical protein
MELKKVIGIVIAAVLAVVSGLVGYNFKADICGEAAPAAIEAK